MNLNGLKLLGFHFSAHPSVPTRTTCDGVTVLLDLELESNLNLYLLVKNESDDKLS